VTLPEDLLGLYFAELGRVRLLGHADEVRLAKTVEAGATAAATLADEGAALPTERRRELKRAVRRAEEAFEHFVAANLRWIRQAIQRGMAGSERTIRLPVALHAALVKVRAARGRLEAEPGQTPTVAELAAATNLPEDRVRRALEAERPTTSLHRDVGAEDGGSELGDVVAVADDAPAEEVVEASWRTEVLTTACEQLDPRSWRILTHRFGLDGAEPATLDRLGDELGISRESVRKLEAQALRELKARLTDDVRANDAVPERPAGAGMLEV
jgi:RNA polymerase sigma factor (sigma-70 family)